MSWQIFPVSLGAFLIFMWLLKHNKQIKHLLYFLVPPVSALLAYMILKEKMIFEDFLGLFLSCLGVFIVSKFQNNTKLKKKFTKLDHFFMVPENLKLPKAKIIILNCNSNFPYFFD